MKKYYSSEEIHGGGSPNEPSKQAVEKCPLCGAPCTVEGASDFNTNETGATKFYHYSPQPLPVSKTVEDYPGKQYQNLFNKLRDWNYIAIQSEMQEIIEIVHRDFPLPTDQQGKETVDEI